LRRSTKIHWERFWGTKKNVDEVYSNADRILRNLLGVVDLQGKRVLEVGAGTGRDSFGLVRHGAEVFQLDYSAASLSIVQALAKREAIKVHLIRGDAFLLPFPSEIFDIVFHQGLLEHFESAEAEKLLEENRRVLKKGGFLLIDVPQRYHPYTLLKHFLIFFNAWFAGWEREFSIGELQRLLRAHGFRIVHSYGEWMYPSLFYRIVRELLRRIGVKLPLYPRLIRPLSELRRAIRERSWRWKITKYTAISIGVVGQKDSVAGV